MNIKNAELTNLDCFDEDRKNTFNLEIYGLISSKKSLENVVLDKKFESSRLKKIDTPKISFS